MRKKAYLWVTMALMLSAAGCAQRDSGDQRSLRTEPTAHIPVIETAVPTPDPVYEVCGSAVVEGTETELVLADGLQCARREDLEKACGYEIGTEDAYIPLELWCIDNKIGMLTDEEQGMMYCTRAAGNRSIPKDCAVPVLMYGEVRADDAGGDAGTIKLSRFEEQAEFLVSHGYTPIWFEDLEYADTIEKPVILTFEGPYAGNYEYLFPVLNKYQMKATVFYFPNVDTDESGYMTQSQVRELSDSGLVQIQSRTMDNLPLDTLPKDEQKNQLEQSRMAITRLTGKIPYVVAYPEGVVTDYVVDLIHEGVYRFGVKNAGQRTYNTSDDRALVWRFSISRSTTLTEYEALLDSVFSEAQNGVVDTN